MDITDQEARILRELMTLPIPNYVSEKESQQRVGRIIGSTPAHLRFVFESTAR